MLSIENVINHVNESIPFDYYANDFPASIENCAFVRVEGGQPPDNYIIGLNRPNVQIGVRHKHGKEAERIANEIWKYFHGKTHFDMDGVDVKSALCTQSAPLFLDKDRNQRTMYSINVALTTIT